ncbi:MAG: coproporphyrinogen III oxidase, partial [Limnohabitans sp.]
MRSNDEIGSLDMPSNMNPAFDNVQTYLKGLQQNITSALMTLDGKPFLSDAWEKPAIETLQGNGITMIMEQGNIFERAGCGFSHVR